MAVLTDIVNPQAYWRKLKQRLTEEGNQTVTSSHALKLRAADGKMRFTDVADQEQLFRLIQSIPSPKAEPFKQWYLFYNECITFAQQSVAQIDEEIFFSVL